MLRSGVLPSAAVAVPTFDLDDVGALLALMLRSESVCVHVSLGEATRAATTACQPPAVRRAARLSQPRT